MTAYGVACVRTTDRKILEVDYCESREDALTRRDYRNDTTEALRGHFHYELVAIYIEEALL